MTFGISRYLPAIANYAEADDAVIIKAFHPDYLVKKVIQKIKERR